MQFNRSPRGDYVVSIPMHKLYAIFRRAIEYHEMPNSDKDAVTQNFCCLVEKELGIFPNVGPLHQSIIDDRLAIDYHKDCVEQSEEPS